MISSENAQLSVHSGSAVGVTTVLRVTENTTCWKWHARWNFSKKKLGSITISTDGKAQLMLCTRSSQQTSVVASDVSWLPVHHHLELGIVIVEQPRLTIQLGKLFVPISACMPLRNRHCLLKVLCKHETFLRWKQCVVT